MATIPRKHTYKITVHLDHEDKPRTFLCSDWREEGGRLVLFEYVEGPSSVPDGVTHVPAPTATVSLSLHHIVIYRAEVMQDASKDGGS